MSNWFDNHVVIVGVGDVDTDAIKDSLKAKFESSLQEGEGSGE
jgi:predicted Zn-dependent peptidase